MSPATAAFNLDHQHHHSSSRREINGLRPSPLRINKDSHPIHKSSSSALAPVAPQQQQQRQQHRPVIIYTHSPKIIHSKPQDFMALVQKLTGRSSSDNQIIASKTAASDEDFKSETNVVRENNTSVDLNTSSENSFLSDFPLLTPTSAADFFCSPNKISPSFLEFLRGYIA